MNPGRQAAAGEYARRVNRAAALLRQRRPQKEVMVRVARLYALSVRQARRYVDAAQRLEAPLPVPEVTVVFTIKVPASLPPRVRQRARAEGRSMSAVVTSALTAYLHYPDPGARGGTPEG